MGEKILLVEDESITRASIADLLRQHDYEVDEAPDGVKAAELFGTRHFDLLITDLVMPKMNGFKLITAVHSMSPHTPIVLITAYLSLVSGKAILGEKAEVVAKPIDPDVLLTTVKHFLTPRIN
ncbi:MAG: response regulator [Gammaproteobacteria bacterium]